MTRDGELRNRWENTHRWSPGSAFLAKRLRMNGELQTTSLAMMVDDGDPVDKLIPQPEGLRIQKPGGDGMWYIEDCDGVVVKPPTHSVSPAASREWCEAILANLRAAGLHSLRGRM